MHLLLKHRHKILFSQNRERGSYWMLISCCLFRVASLVRLHFQSSTFFHVALYIKKETGMILKNVCTSLISATRRAKTLYASVLLLLAYLDIIGNLIICMQH